MTHSWVEHWRVPLLMAAVLSLTACVAQDPLGVRVRGAQTDVVFGAPTSPPLANFPPATVQQPPQSTPSFVRELFPLEEPTFDLGEGFDPPPVPARPTCPDAGLNDFPKAAASDVISTLPAAGKYRWKLKGKVQNPGMQPITIDGFQTRYLRRVSGAAGSHTFQALERDQTSGRVLVSTFKVKSESSNMLADALDPVGLQLVRVDELDEDGEPRAVLQPRPPLVYLPLPVTPGESFSSRAIDAATGAVLTMEGQVRGRQRVDACGDIVDGWLVKATQSFTPKAGGSTSSRTYDYAVATQLGGILTSEHVQSGDTFDVRFEIGQLVPGRLPEKLK